MLGATLPQELYILVLKAKTCCHVVCCKTPIGSATSRQLRISHFKVMNLTLHYCIPHDVGTLCTCMHYIGSTAEFNQEDASRLISCGAWIETTVSHTRVYQQNQYQCKICFLG